MKSYRLKIISWVLAIWHLSVVLSRVVLVTGSAEIEFHGARRIDMIELSIVMHRCNCNTCAAEASGVLEIQDQSGLHSSSWGYTMRYHFSSSPPSPKISWQVTPKRVAMGVLIHCHSSFFLFI